MYKKVSRGLKNNNPFNIRKSNNKWFGKIPGKDKEFETFDTLVNGYRAGIALLTTYYNKYHLHTIFDIINRFAPSLETIRLIILNMSVSNLIMNPIKGYNF